MRKPTLTGPEQYELRMSGLADEIKKLRAEIALLEANPYSEGAKEVVKKFSTESEEFKDFVVELKNQLLESSELEKKAFYPALNAGDSAGFEMQLADANKTMASIRINGLTGIMAHLEDLEQSIQIGRIDFATSMINKLNNYFKAENITTGSVVEKFKMIENDFLNSEDRLGIKNKMNDLRKAKKLVDNYQIKNS